MYRAFAGMGLLTICCTHTRSTGTLISQWLSPPRSKIMYSAGEFLGDLAGKA